MTQVDLKAAPKRTERPVDVLHWLAACIRFDEVCVLQGAPLLGACFSMQAFNLHNLMTIAALVVGNLFLVAHVFVLNDWAGIEGDMNDLNRAARTFVAKGVRRYEVGYLAITLLALALLLFGSVSMTAFVAAVAIAVLSALYSAPGINGKGRPIFNSALHLAGGTLHFLLGYSAFSSVSGPGIAFACYFGIVFAAGHLTHEARDYDSDLRNGIRTNAVTFGRRRAVLASLVLFTIAYALLTGLALSDFVPLTLAFTVLFYPLHLFATFRAIRPAADFGSLRRLQDCYRRIHAVIGLVMLVAVPPWW